MPNVMNVMNVMNDFCQVLVDHLWSECVSSHVPKTQDDFKKKMLDMDEFWQVYITCCNFSLADLWNSIKEGFIPMIGKTVRDVTVPPLIVGDSAFPLCSWLLKPYTNAVLTPQQHYFNYRLSRARMVTEAAYGQLKGR